DRDGNTPFDLLNATIDDTSPTPLRLTPPPSTAPISTFLGMTDLEPTDSSGLSITGGTELYTWGVNANYVLAHADSDNRTFPERARVAPSRRGAEETLVTQVAMAKLHTAVVTSAAEGNLYVCGFGNGGRLGGSLETQLTLRSVGGIGGRVRNVALGRDHTVVVTEKGEVFTFGSNRFGQLGYQLEHKEDEEPIQLTPRKVVTGLKREFVVGAVASRFHTVVHTNAEMFTVRHTAKRERAIRPAQDCHTAAGAGDCAGGGYGYRYSLSATVARRDCVQRIWAAENHILAGGDNYLGAISSMNEFFVWSTPPSPLSQPPTNIAITTAQQLPFQPTAAASTVPVTALRSRPATALPWRVWMSKAGLRDAAIGQNGSVVVCTEPGHVFVGTPRKELKRDKLLVEPKYYKFVRVPLVQRVIMVAANPSGAFAAVKADRELLRVTVRREMIVEDLRRALPQYAGEVGGKDKEDEIGSKGDEDEDVDVEETNGRRQHSACTSSSDGNVLLDNWDHLIADAEDDELLDVIFVTEGRRAYAHRIVLAARSPFFNSLFRGDPKQATPEETIRGLGVRTVRSGVFGDGRLRTEITLPDNYHLQSLLLLLDYLYTDAYAYPWDPAVVVRAKKVPSNHIPLPPSILQLELKSLADIFNLPALSTSVSSSYLRVPASTLRAHLAAIADDLEAYAHLADITLHLADRRVRCHEVVLVRRCPFFEAMFGIGSAWVMHRREREGEGVTVNLKHMRWEMMKVVLRHVYGDFGEEVFENVEKESADELVDFVIEVMAAANELLLTRLKEVCEAMLRRFVVLRNVTMILDVADMYEAEQLKAACLDYICVNMETMLESRLLEGLEDHFINSIEHELRCKQAKKMPTTRGVRPPEPTDNFCDTHSDPHLSYRWGLWNDIYETIRPVPPTSVRPAHTTSSSTDSTSDSGADDMIFRMDEHTTTPPAALNPCFAGPRSPTTPKKSVLFAEQTEVDPASPLSKRRERGETQGQASGVDGSPSPAGMPSPHGDGEELQAKSVGSASGSLPKAGWTAPVAPVVEYVLCVVRMLGRDLRTMFNHPIATLFILFRSKPSLREILEQESRVSTQRQSAASPGKKVAGWPVAPSPILSPYHEHSLSSVMILTTQLPSPQQQSPPDQSVAATVKPKLSQRERSKLKAAAKAEPSLQPAPPPAAPKVAWTSPWAASGGSGTSNGGAVAAEPGRKTSLVEIQQEARRAERGDAKNRVGPQRVGTGANSGEDAGVVSGKSPSLSSTPLPTSHGATPMHNPPTTIISTLQTILPTPQCKVGGPSSAYGATTGPSLASSFASIQKQQQYERNVLRGRVLKKSLLRIQTEERAVEALKEFYVQTAEVGSGEWFTIERDAQGVMSGEEFTK
ncbi:LOW QUALITY PROTEIN: hypothetical protein BC938DRAFT_472250, partial [Jimgerdemannia flammicorona]